MRGTMNLFDWVCRLSKDTKESPSDTVVHTARPSFHPCIAIAI